MIKYHYNKDGSTLFSYDSRNRLTGSGYAYDVIGNPTTYRSRSLTWTGKQLTSYAGTTFTYDGKGRRKSKGNITFTYDCDGNLIKQSNGLEFFYDSQGVAGFVYNGNNYYYQKDIQGNVIAIKDSDGDSIVKYYYDAWGDYVMNGNSTIGVLNPFRYRSYYYDTEIGLYYLQTRYYDPYTCRFLNMDSIDYADPSRLGGLNLYSYCNNDPVNNVDPTGHSLMHWIAGGLAVLGIALAVVAVAVLAAGVGTALAGTMTGAVIYGVAKGALVGAGIGITSGAISGGIASGWTAEGIFTGMGIGLFAGAVIGAVLGGIGGAIKYAKATSYLKSNGITDVKGTLSNFEGIPSVRTSNGTIGYRYYDGINALQNGRYLTNALTDNPVIDLVLYNNNATMVSKFAIQDGAKYLVGRIAGSPVNAIQYFVANINWLTLIP